MLTIFFGFFQLGNVMVKVLDGAQCNPSDRDDRRNAILRTATKLWGRVGYHAVSLRRIADEAVVAPSLIDHHFGTKINLFAHAIAGFSEACNDARHELQPTYSHAVTDTDTDTDTDTLTIERIALGFIRPIELLAAEGELGRDALRLCLTHWLDPTPALRWHLERTFASLRIVVVDMLSTVLPSESLTSLQMTSQLGFLGAISIIIESAGHASDTSARDTRDTEVPGMAIAKRFIVAAMRSTPSPAISARRIEDITSA